MKASDGSHTLGRFAAGSVSGLVAGLLLGRGALFVLNPEWLHEHQLLQPLVLGLALAGGIAGAWCAVRSPGACRMLGATSIAAAPLLLIGLWGRAMQDGWVLDAMPKWWWASPVALLAAGLVGLRCARRSPVRPGSPVAARLGS